MGQLSDSLTIKYDAHADDFVQAIARILISTFFVIGLGIYHYLFEYGNSTTQISVYLSIIYTLLAIIYLLWIRRRNQFISVRRYFVLFTDITIVCCGVYLFANKGFIFYPTLLWITIAYGMRYGKKLLFIASIASTFAFTLTLFINQTIFEFPEVSIALIIGFIVLPLLFVLILNQKERISSAYQQQLKKNQYLMTHDPLTGLPNRVLIEELLELEIATAKRNDYSLSVAFIDIDDFNKINDSIGHKTGDELLLAMAQCIQKSLRSSDYLAHLGGDDFLIILKNNSHYINEVVVIERLIEHISGKYSLSNKEVFINLSIGISQFPSDADSAQNMIMHADTALFQAKKQNGSSYRFYEQSMSSTLKDDLSIQDDLRHALENEEFYLVFQPQISLFSGKITGAEALIRWKHPIHGELSPERFIPYAEHMGLIDKIGEWVLNCAIKQNDLWQKAGLAEIVIAVNLSVHQIHKPELVENILKILNLYEMEPKYLELEVTESMLLEQTELALSILGRIKSSGIHLAMDDFGTGYSSLATLHRFPFTKLKIDRAFINTITHNPNQAEIAKSIIALGHALKMTVIAEGVETEAQAHYLQRHQCDEIQGYLFSKPLLAEEFTMFLSQKKTPSWMFSYISERQKPAILVVDDDKIALKAICSILKKSDIDIYSANNTSVAFDLLSNKKIGVLLTDNQMPDMLGIEFLARVKTLYPDIVRMLITGNADVATAQDAVNRGAVFRFLTKNTPPDELLHTIDDAISLYRYQEANQDIRA